MIFSGRCIKKPITYFGLIVFVLFCIISNTQAQSTNKKLRTADNAFNQLKYTEAIKAYKKRLHKDSSNIYAIKQIAECYWKIRDFKNSLFWYKRFTVLGADSFSIIHRYIDVLNANGAYQESINLRNRYFETHNDSAIFKEGLQQLSQIDTLNSNQNAWKIAFVNINSNYRDFSPVFYADGIAFVSTRPVNGSVQKNSNKNFEQEGKDWCRIYTIPDKEFITEAPAEKISFIEDGIKKLHNLPDNNLIKIRHANLGPITFSRDGKTAYCTVNKKLHNHVSPLEIMSAPVVNGVLGKPKPFKYNDANFSVEHPALSPDGRFLYFVSDMDGGQGHFDIYSCKRDSDTLEWERPRNLGKIVNTSGNELFPFVDAYGNLYFSSDGLLGLGALDIFRVKMKDGIPIGSPINLGTPVNSPGDDFGISFYTDLSNGFFSSNRRNGNDDIYKFIYTRDALYVRGVILDSITKLMMDKVTINIKETKGDGSFTYQTTKSGFFSSQWEKENLLDVEMKKPGYQTYHDTVNTADLRDHFLMVFLKPNVVDSVALMRKKKLLDSTYVVAANEQPIVDDEVKHFTDSLNASVIERKSVKFDYGNVDIHEGDADSLAKIVAVLRDNPDANIVIAGFTDCKGKNSVNRRLARKRIAAIKKYFRQKGISSSRINTENFGKDHLLVPCKEDSSYDKDKQTANRRVEILVTKEKKSTWKPSGKETDIKDIIHSLIKKSQRRNAGASKNKKAVTEKNANKKVSQDEMAGNNKITKTNRTNINAQSQNDTLSISSINGKSVDVDTSESKKRSDLFYEAFKRMNKPPVTIVTNSDSVHIELYDNGIFDYDTISVIYNNEIVVFKQLLEPQKSISFYAKISDDEQKNKMLFFADNLGLIPPNSALMVITDVHGKRTEVSVNSDLHQNTIIYFVKPKKQ